jgi:Na+-translocating ferredoxin:NAD+ oxidoreductase subunit B
MDETPYRQLAERLNALPNGFPPTPDGTELRLLAKLYTPEEAALAAQLRLTRETAQQIAARLGGDPAALRKRLKGMASRGLIAAGRASRGLGYGLLPFVVGIYEAQGDRLDAELARLFEDYYLETFSRSLQQQPPVHRVVPVNESVRNDLAVRPYESVAAIIAGAKAWGVTDCICRKQQALIGQPCPHPVDVCMVFGDVPGAFDDQAGVHALTQAEALVTLRRAAEAGLVHSVSNNQRGLWYVCNCCTCACAILRALAELGLGNVIAPSAFVCQVDEARCSGCSLCAERCSFSALTVTEGLAHVQASRCAGCGVCTLACPDEALSLVARPEADRSTPPETEEAWRQARAAALGLDLEAVR